MTLRMTSDITTDNRALVLDLVEWVAREPRTYAALMDAWRTSCPRLTIWEDAIERGLVSRETFGGVAMVAVTAAGQEVLRRERRLLSHSMTAHAAE